MAAFARQLGRPSGFSGRVVGRLLNRGNRALVLAAVGAAEVVPGAAVADIGFGGGAGIGPLIDGVGTSGTVHGVEMSTAMLAEAAKRFADEIAAGTLVLHDAQMHALPLPDNALDAVISTNTIYFIEDLAAAVAELARVLRPGGTLALGIGDSDRMATMPFTQYGFRLRPVNDIIAILRDAGFTAIEDRRVGDGPGTFHLLVAVSPLS